jgi:hypothetical protein
MPRGWRFRVPKPKKPRRPRGPKMPKPPKMPRPKAKDLRMIYKGFITASVQNRIATLAYALQWYDGALPYVIQKAGLTPDVQKKLETAVKCRKQAMGTNVDHEKETAFLMALRCYEKACDLLKPPLVDKALDEFRAKQVVLAEKQAKLEQRYGFVVKLLQGAAGNRIKLEVADAVKPVQYNPSLTTLSYNREAVKSLAEKYKVEGLMPVFIDQLEVLSRHAALTPDGNGGLQYSADDQIKVMGEMLHEFVKYAKGADAPRRLVKSGQLIPRAPQATLNPAAPRPPHLHQKGPRALGRWAPGGVPYKIWERINDHQTKQETDVLQGMPAGYAKKCLEDMAKVGTQSGGAWEIKLDAGTVTLIENAGGQP